jgi:hypothetical protein
MATGEYPALNWDISYHTRRGHHLHKPSVLFVERQSYPRRDEFKDWH